MPFLPHQTTEKKYLHADVDLTLFSRKNGLRSSVLKSIISCNMSQHLKYSLSCIDSSDNPLHITTKNFITDQINFTLFSLVI